MPTIKSLRMQQDMTQTALAIRAGVQLATLQKYEQGIREPTIGRLRLLASALGVTVDEIEFTHRMTLPNSQTSLCDPCSASQRHCGGNVDE